MSDREEQWIKDGTVAEAPVTESTPAIDTAPPAVEAAPVIDAAPVAEAPAPTVDVAAATAAAAEAQEEFLEGMYKGQPYKIPKGVELPLERKGVKTYEPITKIQQSGMFEQDYRIKTAEAAEMKRAADLATKAAVARAAEAEKWAAERAEEAKKAMLSPEEREKYDQYVHQYNTNESFRKMVDDAREGRLSKAEAAVYSDAEYQTVVANEVSQIKETIADLAKQYPLVDPDVVRANYSRDLQGDAPPPISREAVEYYYKVETAKAERIVSPFTSELAALKAKVAEMEALQAANAHNAKTDRSINRALSPVAKPASGAPAAPAAPQVKGKTMEERTQSWVELAS